MRVINLICIVLDELNVLIISNIDNTGSFHRQLGSDPREWLEQSTTLNQVESPMRSQKDMLLMHHTHVEVNGQYYLDVLQMHPFFLDIRVITDNYLISQQESALAHRTQVTQLVHVGTPDFIPPIFWPPNIPYDLNPADYDIWSVLNKEV